jgi:hypothetical integral membrane protein (TIGR02206 family)
MTTEFRLFGPLHWAILAAVPALGYALARLSRRWPRGVRIAIGVSIAANELIWWAYRYSSEGLRLPEGLPLELCDVIVWVTVAACLAPRRWTYETAYYLGLSGTALALITPDLWAPLWSYPTLYFFLAHGLIVAAVLMLTWGGAMKPSPGSLWRVLAIVNGYALFAGTFNLFFRTNYMYLCEKPAAGGLLDYMGPWPWYILSGEALAVVLFTLLWLPFRRR